jgi:hypothetical protein
VSVSVSVSDFRFLGLGLVREEYMEVQNDVVLHFYIIYIIKI